MADGRAKLGRRGCLESTPTPVSNFWEIREGVAIWLLSRRMKPFACALNAPQSVPERAKMGLSPYGAMGMSSRDRDSAGNTPLRGLHHLPAR